MIQNLSIILLVLSLSACSIEENNRKALTEKHNNITAFQAELLNEPDAELVEFDSYIQIKLKSEQQDIRGMGAFTRNNTPFQLRTTDFYFVKPDHYAYPTLVIHEQVERGKDSWWSWQSAVDRKRFNKWFEEEFWYKKRPQDRVSCTTTFTVEQNCPSFSEDQLTKLTRQSAMIRKLRIYAQCRCETNSN